MIGLVLLIESPGALVPEVALGAQIEPDPLLALHALVPRTHNGAHTATIAPHAKVDKVLGTHGVARRLEDANDAVLKVRVARLAPLTARTPGPSRAGFPAP